MLLSERIIKPALLSRASSWDIFKPHIFSVHEHFLKCSCLICLSESGIQSVKHFSVSVEWIWATKPDFLLECPLLNQLRDSLMAWGISFELFFGGWVGRVLTRYSGCVGQRNGDGWCHRRRDKWSVTTHIGRKKDLGELKKMSMFLGCQKSSSSSRTGLQHLEINFTH